MVQTSTTPELIAIDAEPIRTGGPAGQKFRETAPVVVAMVWGCDTALFFLLGGGLALRTYFREQRSWENAQHAREVDRLRRQKNEADLRLTVLQAQVEPHADDCGSGQGVFPKRDL